MSQLILSDESPTSHKILILDYGSQYAHLLLRRCRESCVYSELHEATIKIQDIIKYSPSGIILSGGPASCYEVDAPHVCSELWDYCYKNAIPVLGVCYGMQDMQYQLGGKVRLGVKGEFGPTTLYLTDSDKKDTFQSFSTQSTEGSQNEINCVDILFFDVPKQTTVWMSHRDEVSVLAPQFKNLCRTDSCKYGAASCPERLLWCVQFHPEVSHTIDGKQIFSNFFHKICKIPQNAYTLQNHLITETKRIKKLVGDRHVIGAMSGGVDSMVAATLVHKTIGQKFHGILVDTGLLRKNELEVATHLRRCIPNLDLTIVDSSKRFFQALASLTDPEQKRKKIGNLFIEVFMDEIEKLKKKNPEFKFDNAMLLQGTICTDVIESAQAGEANAKSPQKIKTHHNVGGLPEKLNIDLLEPLRLLFKDEVRQLGLLLGCLPELLYRHPFPGPGLAIRIIGEVSPSRVALLREADSIFEEELKASGHYYKISQAFTVLLPDCRTVGVLGDLRSYGMTIVLRAIESTDLMTADWYDLPRSVLKKCSTRIINEVQNVNRVCYDISSKPPATIEWE